MVTNKNDIFNETNSVTLVTFLFYLLLYTHDYSYSLLYPTRNVPRLYHLVLGSPVSGLQKDRDWTGPRPVRTRNSQDRRRPQPQSGLQSLKILEISRPTKEGSNRFQLVF